MTEHKKRQEQIAYWLDLARYDYKTAEAMLKTGRFLYVGFMCHQAVEKTTKAYFVKHCNRTPPYTHNLSLLVGETGLLAVLSEEQKLFVSLLQPLNVESRYPTYKDDMFKSLDKKECAKLLLQTKEFCRWLQNRL